jgi:hypothetical protein
MLAKPELFTIDPNTQSGDVYATAFTVFFNESYQNFAKVTWDLGDGTFFYNVSSVNHVYNFPGVYTVSISAWTNEGQLIRDAGEIDVDYVYRDALLITKVPDAFGIPGLITQTPFVVSLTSAKIDEPLNIVLQALNTDSTPHYAVPSKWEFLVPRWRFIDYDTKQIIQDSVRVKTNPIYKDNKVVAVSGEVLFYYVDDLATGIDPNESCPLLIVATLSTENFIYPPESLRYPYYSYSNSEVTRAVIAWQVNDTVPTNLKITENYLSDIYSVKWENVPIPVMITCEFKFDLLDSYNYYEIASATDVLSYPRRNLYGSQYPVILTLSSTEGLIDPSLYTVGESIKASYTVTNQIATVISPGHNFNTNEYGYFRIITGDLLSNWYYSITANSLNTFSFSASGIEDTSGELYFEKPLYFQARDSENNVTSGYIFTTITPLTTFNTSLVVSVSTTAVNQIENPGKFLYPHGYPIYPNVYISHPNQKSINRLNVITFPTFCTNILYFKNLGLLLDGTLTFTEVPAVSNTDVTNYELSGYSGIYGLAFNPLVNRLYAADADSNNLLCFHNGQILLTSVNVSSVTNDIFNTPSYISTDRENNVWVSLYNKHSLLKYDKDLNFLLSAVPTVSIELSSYSTGLNGGIGDPLIAPPVVETDQDNNVWACFAHEDWSLLVKFDGTTGQQLTSVSLQDGLIHSPIGLAIDPNKNVWVAGYHSNSLQKISTNGTILSTVTSFYRPSYIAFDRDGQLWVTHGYNFCGVLNTETNQTSSWKFTNELRDVVRQDIYTQQDIDYINSNNEIWGGLASDVFNRLWAINSEKKTVTVINPKEPTVGRVVQVVPFGATNYILNSNETFVTEVPTTIVRSAQAAGDWTGNKWYQKYGGDLSVMPISGFSTPFDVYPIDSFRVAKVNEEFNMSEYYKSLALPEYMQLFTNLFDNFFGAAVGTGDLTKEEIGRVVYEKIANFVENHSDYETANIPQLKSLAKEIGVELKTFGIDFPVEVNRLIDLLSIPKHYLRGKYKYETDLSKLKGNLLTSNSILTAGSYIYMQDRQYKNLQLVFVAPLSTEFGIQTLYPLSALEISGARHPLLTNYIFFEKNTIITGFENNVINWDSSQTTINYNVSSSDQWYSDNGVVDLLFNNILTKRLFS